jgi:hypothetical protein
MALPMRANCSNNSLLKARFQSLFIYSIDCLNSERRQGPAHRNCHMRTIVGLIDGSAVFASHRHELAFSKSFSGRAVKEHQKSNDANLTNHEKTSINTGENRA